MTDRNERRERLYRQRIEAEAAAREHLACLGKDAYSVELANVNTWCPEGVSAVICDPPYLPRDTVRANYASLARMAVDVLPPGGHAVAMCDVGTLADVLDVMSIPGLNYRGCVSWELDRRSASQHWPRRCFQRWKPVVVFCRGSWSEAQWYAERHLSEGADKDLHPWQQSLSGFSKLVRWFTQAGEKVATPFCGSGTVGVAALATGRRWAGCDTDPVAVDTARDRVLTSDYAAPAIVR